MTGIFTYSALVLTHDRDRHLRATIDGLAHQSRPPAELIIAWMNQAGRVDLPSEIPTRHIDIADTNRLPLARARNAAARAAHCDALVFLDVDCIPSVDFASTLLDDLDRFGGLVMGTPRYLPYGFRPNDDLDAQSRPHPEREHLTPGPRSDFATFWSLCFATTTSDFEQVGGFDEQFRGYGAEDTDLAFEYRRNGLPYALSDATVFHQYHDTYRPPLQHFEDIVENARRFYDKWSAWPMEGWLTKFRDMELIDWDESDERIATVRLPTSEQIHSAKSSSLFG